MVQSILGLPQTLRKILCSHAVSDLLPSKQFPMESEICPEKMGGYTMTGGLLVYTQQIKYSSIYILCLGTQADSHLLKISFPPQTLCCPHKLQLKGKDSRAGLNCFQHYCCSPASLGFCDVLLEPTASAYAEQVDLFMKSSEELRVYGSDTNVQV